MTKPRLNRAILLPRLADHVLAHGLAGASLRPLAKAAGTSDRMLLYHFGSKQTLVEALLDHLAERFTQALDTAFPGARAASRQACFESVIEVTSQPAFAPFFTLWWDIVGGCARGDETFLAAAGRIMDELLAWVEGHLPEDDPDPRTGAKLVLTLIEGAQMLEAVGRAAIGREAVLALHAPEEDGRKP